MQTQRQPRILCISPFFPPVANSESFCAGKQIKALREAGVELKVLYCSNINGPETREDDSPCWRDLKEVATNVRIPARRNNIKTVAWMAHYQTHFYVRWIHEIVCLAKRLHADRQFDVVYSRSLPTVGHIAGYWCAHSLELPWVVSMNDPWDTFAVPGRGNEGTWLYRKASEHWLRRTLKNADLVIYPSDRLRCHHERITGLSRSAIVIPHVGQSAASDSMSDKRRQPLFRLVHAGKLGANEKPYRHTNALLLGLRGFLSSQPDAKESVRLILVGPGDSETNNEIARLSLQHNIEVADQVSYEDSLAYISGANVCILVEAALSEGIFLPSKLVDYLVARKPILALSPRVGVVEDLARRGGIMRVDVDDASEVQGAIATLYAQYRRGSLESLAPTNALANDFSANIIAEQFMSAIQPLQVSVR
jgi:glycosyltransferase involved in cell wall biosynthesis